MELQVKNINGKVVDSIAIDPDSIPVKGTGSKALYFYIKAYRNNQRQGTVSAKTRGEVSGGGKKPWRQKGTGRARVGSIRSPLWRGGGIIFGPRPRSYREKINKSLKKAALRAALKDALITEGKIIIVDTLDIDSIKTKKLYERLKALGVSYHNCLVASKQISNELYLSSRNLANVVCKLSKDINPFDILWSEKIVISKEGWEELINKIK